MDLFLNVKSAIEVLEQEAIDRGERVVLEENENTELLEALYIIDKYDMTDKDATLLINHLRIWGLMLVSKNVVETIGVLRNNSIGDENE